MKPLFHRLGILTVYSQFILNSILLAKSEAKLATMTREYCHKRRTERGGVAYTVGYLQATAS